MASMIPSLYYRYCYLHESQKPEKIQILLTEKKSGIILTLLNLAVGVMMIVLSIKNAASWQVVLEQQILLHVLIAAAGIDYSVKKIPNILVAVMLLVWIVFLGIDFVQDPDFSSIGTRLLQALGGFLTGGIILLIFMLLSRGGVGAGDVKLVAVLGLFYGMIGILNILFYSCLFAAIISIILLVAKKLRLKDTVAMSPFILMAVSAYNLMSI